MKKRLLCGCLVVAMVALVLVSIGVYKPAFAYDKPLRNWHGFNFNFTQLIIPPSGSDVEFEKAALEKKIEQSESGYSRVRAISSQMNIRGKTKTYTQITTYLDTILSFNRPKWDPIGESFSAFQSTPTAMPTTSPSQQPAQPSQQPTPTPSVPDPVNTVELNTPTDYYFASSGDQWQEVWYNTSSFMYLRGSVPADCDTSRTDCWQLSFDLDGETVTVQGSGCVDGNGTSLSVGFAFDDDLINKAESHFIKGGDNVPLTFRYYAGNTLKKASVAGQPKLMLTYDGWLKLYVAR